MQKKFSYSVVKWTVLLGIASSLATACVVTTGDGSLSDGGDGNTTDGGEPSSSGGSSSTAGKGGSSAGKGGSSSAGTSTGGTAAGGDSGGTTAGGGTAAYVPGKCQAELDKDLITPSDLPSCDDAKPDEDPCRKCLRTNSVTCPLWQQCYASGPTTACGFGPAKNDGGQFGCILSCYFENKDGLTDPDALFASCGSDCALQCDTVDNGAIIQSTNDLADEAYKKCNAECFPFN